MTPEQKAFFEYGASRYRISQLKQIIKRNRDVLSALSGKSYEVAKRIVRDIRRANLSLRKDLRATIQDSWQLRKECRKWVPLEQRYCKNCLHEEKSWRAQPCKECNQHDNAIHWHPQPRKGE